MNNNHDALLQEKRMAPIIYGTVIIFLLIIGKLMYLQINLADHLAEKSTHNYLRTEITVPLRGNIVDRHEKLLATNRPIVDLIWQGTGGQKLGQDQEELIQLIMTLLNVPCTEQLLFKQNIMRAERMYTRHLIKQDIDLNILSALQERFPGHQNLLLKTGFKRFYPHHDSAGHIVGYLSYSTNNNDPEGKMGLEHVLDPELKGTYGAFLNTINSVGRKITAQEISPALSGSTIHTTLDFDIQTLCELVFNETYVGTMIVMDPENGDILALISRPTFDPNIFLSPISAEDWKDIQAKKPFLNRALNATYPPGSIFKLITVSAALENKIITAESAWYCKGYFTFGDRDYWCHCRHGHGLINVTQAIAKSCNTICFNIGTQIDIDMLASYASIFGLGEPTEILFPEKKGLVPNRQWKKRALKSRWFTGETLSVCIGQSYLLVTPMQIARMISGIFTGFLPKPRILLSEEIDLTPLPIRDETRNILKQSMRLVVETGTGSQVNKNKDFSIYGKTSTAQTSSLEKRTLGREHLEHGWFVAHVRYKQLKPLVLVVLVEHAGTSRVPTGIAQKFLVGYKKLIDEQSNTTHQEQSTYIPQFDTSLPNNEVMVYETEEALT